MRILFATLSFFAGAMLLLSGYRLAQIVITLWGFVAGLSMGGAVISAMNSTPFLGTALGVFIGVTLGLILALFAYFYYSIAVVVLCAALGYWIGSSFMVFLGLNHGLISTLVGIGIGALVGISALLLNAPKMLLIAITSVAGAVITVGSVLLLFNTISLNDFSYSAAQSVISNSFVWTVVTFGLAFVGITLQAMTTSDYTLEQWPNGYSGKSNSKPNFHSDNK